MKSLLLAGGLASGLVVGIVTLPVPAVAAEMCQGQAATLVGSPDISIVGTDGDDVIVTNGSWVGGNDVLRLSFDPGDGCTTQQRRLLGGAGADSLVGSRHGDVLFGGGGRDVADGRGGNDQCRAEVRRHCERR